MPFLDSRRICSSTHSGPAGIVISRYARYVLGSAIDVPARSASDICSTRFIWLVLTAIVTWSGAGSSSASMWRVSSESRFAFALGGKADRATDLQDHFRNCDAQASQQLIEHRQPLRALAVQLADVN